MNDKSVIKRLTELTKEISSSAFLEKSGLGNEMPFYIFDYNPKEEIYKGSASTNYYIRKQGQFIYGKLDFLNQAFGIIPKELDGYESTLDSPAFDILQGLNAKYFSFGRNRLCRV